jgi:hypothetical protein
MCCCRSEGHQHHHGHGHHRSHGCEHHEGHGDHGHWSCGCHDRGEDDGCRCGEGGGGFQRRFQSKGEIIAELEHYLSELKAEAGAVEERLRELRG